MFTKILYVVYHDRPIDVAWYTMVVYHWAIRPPYDTVV